MKSDNMVSIDFEEKEEYEAYTQSGIYYNPSNDNAGPYFGMPVEVADRKYITSLLMFILWGFALAYMGCRVLEYTWGVPHPAFALFTMLVLESFGSLIRYKTEKGFLHFLALTMAGPALLIMIGIAEGAINQTGDMRVVKAGLIGVSAVTAILILVGLIRPTLYRFTGKTVGLTVVAAALADVFLWFNYGSAFWLIWTMLAVLAISLYLAYVLTKAAIHTEGKEKPVTVAFDTYMRVVTTIQKTYEEIDLYGDDDF